MTNIIKLNDKAKNKPCKPEEILQEAIDDIKSGEIKCTKVLIVYVNAEDGKFTTGYYAANLKTYEAVAALECIKHDILEDR